ncbi:MAG: hypothetical protein LBK13_09870 [Spirochaetales bacterium]|nr:hypothetical protein [Spirochaetales bacterium]
MRNSAAPERSGCFFSFRFLIEQECGAVAGDVFLTGAVLGVAAFGGDFQPDAGGGRIGGGFPFRSRLVLCVGG